MAKTEGAITLDLSVKAKVAAVVIRMLYPLVALRMISVDRATAIAMSFVKVQVTVAPSSR